MNEPAVLRCREVTVGYDGAVVLDRVSLEVPRHSLSLLVGPNGAGKTTFVKACLGLIPCTSGTIDRDFGPYPAAYVPQQKKLDAAYPVTVADIVEMGLYPEIGWWRRPGRDARNRVARTLDEFGLRPHLAKRFDELSGGLRQRTLLARAVVARAEVIFLDEPTAGLDSASEAELMRLIGRLNGRGGCTVLWVTHRLRPADLPGARLLRFDGEGKIVC